MVPDNGPLAHFARYNHKPVGLRLCRTLTSTELPCDRSRMTLRGSCENPSHVHRIYSDATLKLEYDMDFEARCSRVQCLVLTLPFSCIVRLLLSPDVITLEEGRRRRSYVTCKTLSWYF